MSKWKVEYLADFGEIENGAFWGGLDELWVLFGAKMWFFRPQESFGAQKFLQHDEYCSERAFIGTVGITKAGRFF